VKVFDLIDMLAGEVWGEQERQGQLIYSAAGAKKDNGRQ